jgi:hypothetical protein
MWIALLLQGALDSMLNCVKRRKDRGLYRLIRQCTLGPAKQSGVTTLLLGKRVKRGCC